MDDQFYVPSHPFCRHITRTNHAKNRPSRTYTSAPSHAGRTHGVSISGALVIEVESTIPRQKTPKKPRKFRSPFLSSAQEAMDICAYFCCSLKEYKEIRIQCIHPGKRSTSIVYLSKIFCHISRLYMFLRLHTHFPFFDKITSRTHTHTQSAHFVYTLLARHNDIASHPRKTTSYSITSASDATFINSVPLVAKLGLSRQTIVPLVSLQLVSRLPRAPRTY